MRDDLRPGIRQTGFERKVTIYFEPIGDRLLILSILYRGRLPSRPDLNP